MLTPAGSVMAVEANRKLAFCITTLNVSKQYHFSSSIKVRPHSGIRIALHSQNMASTLSFFCAPRILTHKLAISQKSTSISSEPRTIYRYHLFPLKCTASPSPFAIWAVLIASATGGQLSAGTKVGSALSPPLVTALITLALTNIGLLPAVNPAYNIVSSTVVPIAAPLLLLGADLRRVASDTGHLLPAFLLGSLSTALATILAFRVIPLASLGSDAWKIASALCARHIGGAVNYVATVEATSASAASIAAGIAADNVVVTLYFLLLFAIARGVTDPKRTSATYSPSAMRNNKSGTTSSSEDSVTTQAITGDQAAVALSISITICAVGTYLSSLIQAVGIGLIPIVTLVTLVVATLFPSPLRRYTRAGSAIGIFFMQIFFAATGASGSVRRVIASAPALFAFCAVQLGIHLALLLLLGRGLAKLHLAELLIASNANVGGPTTAAGMAAAKEWHSLVVPAILVGVLGYSIATFVALGVGHSILRPPI